MQKYIYKICAAYLWTQAESDGVFHGAPIDTEDGFIHFSNAAQVAETAAKHFAGQKNLLLVTVSTSQLGADLKWEKSRGGDLFPHLYKSLNLESVVRVDPMPLGEDGNHLFPEHLQT